MNINKIIIMFCGLLLAGEEGDGITLNHTLHKSYINLAVEYFFCVGKSVQPRQQGCILIKWNQGRPNII